MLNRNFWKFWVKKRHLLMSFYFFILFYLFTFFYKGGALLNWLYRIILFDMLKGDNFNIYTTCFFKNRHQLVHQLTIIFTYILLPFPHFSLKSTHNISQLRSNIIKSRLNISHSILIKLSTLPNLQISQFYPNFTHQLVNC